MRLNNSFLSYFMVLLVFIATSLCDNAVRCAQAQVNERALPDLVVERVWVDNECSINFTIRNNGGKIPEGEYAECIVALEYENNYETFSLSSSRVTKHTPVDPKGSLKNPSGAVSYNTKIKIEKTVKATVSVNTEGNVHESNSRNNEIKDIMLNAECKRA